MANFIARVLHSRGLPYLLHYFDDFLFFGRPATQQAVQVLSLALSTFEMLGIPVAMQKTEGPSTRISFLDILIDTELFELRLPDDKLARLQQLIITWSGKRSCFRRDLDSFFGHLSHAATVVAQGRTFLRELYSLLSMDRAPYHYIRLAAGAKADILWWKVFLQGWNGRSFSPTATPSHQVTSDASGSFDVIITAA